MEESKAHARWIEPPCLNGSPALILDFDDVFLFVRATKSLGYQSRVRDFTQDAQRFLDHAFARPLLTFNTRDYHLRAGTRQLLHAARDEHVVVILTGWVTAHVDDRLHRGAAFLADWIQIQVYYQPYHDPSARCHTLFSKLQMTTPYTALMFGREAEWVAGKATCVPFQPITEPTNMWTIMEQEHFAHNLKEIHPVGKDARYEHVGSVLLNDTTMPYDILKLILEFVGDNRIYAMCCSLRRRDPMLSVFTNNQTGILVAKCSQCKLWNVMHVYSTPRKPIDHYFGECLGCGHDSRLKGYNLARVSDLTYKSWWNWRCLDSRQIPFLKDLCLLQY